MPAARPALAPPMRAACLCLCLVVCTAASLGCQQDVVLGHWRLSSRWVKTKTKAKTKTETIRAVTGSFDIKFAGPLQFQGQGQAESLVLHGARNRLLLDAAVDPAGLPSKEITVAAWLKVDDPLEWGGVIGALEDNGDFERDWLLGYKGDRCSFTLSGKSSPMAGSTSWRADNPGRWRTAMGGYCSRISWASTQAWWPWTWRPATSSGVGPSRPGLSGTPSFSALPRTGSWSQAHTTASRATGIRSTCSQPSTAACSGSRSTRTTTRLSMVPTASRCTTRSSRGTCSSPSPWPMTYGRARGSPRPVGGKSGTSRPDAVAAPSRPRETASSTGTRTPGWWITEASRPGCVCSFPLQTSMAFLPVGK